VSRENELDAGTAKRFDDVEIFLSGHAKNTINTLVLQRSN